MLHPSPPPLSKNSGSALEQFKDIETDGSMLGQCMWRFLSTEPALHTFLFLAYLHQVQPAAQSTACCAGRDCLPAQRAFRRCCSSKMPATLCSRATFPLTFSPPVSLAAFCHRYYHGQATCVVHRVICDMSSWMSFEGSEAGANDGRLDNCKTAPGWLIKLLQKWS